MKSRILYWWIVLSGILVGGLITLSAWLQKWTPLRLPQWTYSVLFLAGIIVIIAYGLYVFCRQPLLSRTWVILAVLVATFFNWIGLASANYIGPNRTVTTTIWERQNCQYRAYVASPSGYCSLTLYYPPSSCPSASSLAGYFSPGPLSCGSSWPGTCGSSISCTITQLNNSTEGCSSGQPGCTSHTSTTTYPSATVSGTTGCTLPGNAGWCRGTATLNLSGNEPLAPSYSLTFFEGSLGTLCSAPSCTWAFPEGNTSFNYWVHSTFGDTSTMSSASMMVDNVAPTLTLTIPPPNGANGWFISSPVTASALATDATSGVSGSPSINGSGTSFTATTDGIYNLTATVSDVAGNTASHSGTIRLDTTPPGLSVSVNPTSPDGSNNWYVSPVVLTGTASDATSGVAGVQVQVDGGSWQNGSSLSEGADGPHTIVFRTTDNAGNTTTSVPVTISVDRTAPNPDASLSPSSPDGANGWYVSPVTLTTSSSDATSGLASQGVSLDGTTWTPSVTVSTDGTYTVQVHAQDNSGNTASSTKTIHLDTTPPTASILLPPADGDNGWHVTPVTVTAGGTDVTSGVANQLVSLDGNPWAPSLTLSADGVYTVQARVTDNAGNATTVSQTIYIDRTPPVISTPVLIGTTGLAGWYTSSVGFSGSATDAMSGVASTQYSLDGGAWQTTAPTLLDGVHSVQIRVTDIASNTNMISWTIKIDATPPSLDVSVPTVDGLNGWYKSPVTLIAAASDVTSGLADILFRVDGGSWTIGTSISVSDGVHTVDFQAQDVAGNQVSSSQTVSVDTTPPSLTVSIPVPQGFENWYTSAPQVTATGSDSGSGVSGFTYSVDGGIWQSGPLTLTDGQHMIDTRITDNAGNYTSSTNAVKVDTTPPQSAFTSPVEGSTTVIHGSFAMNGQTLDPTSGSASAEISLNDGTTWQPLVINGGNWTYTWNTQSVPNGIYTIRVRASDVAGNEEHTASITVIVVNAGPSVSITDSWWSWETAEISIQRNILPVAGASISISDAHGNNRTYTFGGSDLPASFKWDGLWDDGSNRTWAAPGDYTVNVKAWDLFGTTGEATGTVHVPKPLPTPTPTQEPSPTQTEIPSVAMIVPTRTAVPSTPVPLPVATQKPVPAPEARPVEATWPAAFTGSLFVLFLSLSLLDPRPAAWRRLARIKSNPNPKS